MSNKSIPSEVAQGIQSIGTGIINELKQQALEAGHLSNPHQQSPQIQQSQHQPQNKIDEDPLHALIEKEQEIKSGIPSIQMILEQQKEEKSIIEEEKEKKMQEEVTEEQQKMIEQQEQQAILENALSDTGHKKTAHDRFARTSKEKMSKVTGM